MEGPDGLFLATAGATTLIRCDNIDVESWVAFARSVGFEGEVLVLSSGTGEELGRLVRE